ncbi:SpoIIE family protein phosphatase [Shewanella atlantica]|nr:SpoIIE family protein phosphatase [Shewanella atlantica]
MEGSVTSFQRQTAGLRVLVVEDTHSERCFITHLLEKMGLKVTSCSSAEEAIESYRQQKADIVISDWRMPGMSGPELCQYFKKLPFPPYMLLLTGNNLTSHTVTGIESGADDFLTKPFIPSILKARVLAGARIVNMQHQLENKNSELNASLIKEHAYLQQIQEDLNSAAKLQGSLLPTSSTLQNEWRLATQFQPAQELAGDIFQCLEIDDSHLGFYLLDVTGHGIAASMQSFTLAQRLSSNSCDWASLDPALIVSQLNADFEDPEHTGRFATLVLGIVNTISGRVKLTVAGHPLPILLKEQGTAMMELNSGIPLGIDNTYQYHYDTFFVSSQQHLILYSDGLYECRHPSFGEFGQQRLINTCANANQLEPESLLHYLAHAIDLWQQKEPQDDISMMILSAPDSFPSNNYSQRPTSCSTTTEGSNKDILPNENNRSADEIVSMGDWQALKYEALIDSELIESELIESELIESELLESKQSENQRVL